eukprot:scaffold10691_cov46-Attheya_sp.AAC.2
MTADTYYQDVTPADHNIQGSYIDPATPMPNGTTGSSDLYGAPQRGLLLLVGDSQINILKFQEKIAKLILRNDGVTAIRDWFHGIRLALNTNCFSTLLLPVDTCGDIDAKFYNRALNLQNTIVYSQAAVPPTRLITRFIDQLMKCPDIRLFLAHKKTAIIEHTQAFGENSKYPLESLQTVFDHLEDLDVPLELCPKGCSTGNASPISSANIPDAYIARFGSDNAKHGEDTAPLEPLKSWAKIAPPVPVARNVDKQSKFTSTAPVKSSIKYFLADFTGTPVEIDPSKISTMNTSTDSESEIFHEALEDALSTPIEPTIKQFQQNSSSTPLFPDYSSMFDPMGLQQLQENYSF